MNEVEVDKYLYHLQIDESDVVNVSLILNEYDRKDNRIGTEAYKKIAEMLEINIDHDSYIFDQIERFIVAKFYEMEKGNMISPKTKKWKKKK